MIEHFQHLRTQAPQTPAAPGSFKALMQTIEKNREQNLRQLFDKAEIKFKGGSIKEAASEMVDQAVSVGEAASGKDLRPHEEARNNLEAMIESATGALYSEVVGFIPSIGDVIGKLTPFVAIYNSVKDLLSSINEFRKTVMQRYRAAKAIGELAAGDAVAAAAGVTRMINRLMVNTGVDMLRSTTQFAAGVATMSIDGGLAVNITATVTQFIQTLVSIGLDIAECKAGRTCLQQSVLDKRIFSASPLMGCYFVACSNTSDLVGMLGIHTNQENWMRKVERSKQKIDFLQDSARRFIANSRLEVTGLPTGLVRVAA